MNLDRMRMAEWLAIALVLYAVCITLRTFNVEPQVQVVLWKLGNITIAAWVGYLIDRRAFLIRMEPDSPPLEQVRRAIVIAAAMLAVALGL